MQVGKSGNLQACSGEEPSDERQIPLATKPQKLTPLQIILDSNDITFANKETLLTTLWFGLGLRISLTMQNSLTYFLFVREQYENFKASKPYMLIIDTKSCVNKLIDQTIARKLLSIMIRSLHFSSDVVSIEGMSKGCQAALCHATHVRDNCRELRDRKRKVQDWTV